MPRELFRFDCRDFVLRERVYAPGLRMPRHTHDYSNVTVILGGSIDERSAGATHRGTAGSVVWKPAGCEHENAVSGFGARTLTIELRRGAMRDNLASRSWSWFEDPVVVRAALALTCATRDAAEEQTTELLAVVAATPRGNGGAAPWLEQIVTTLQSHFDEPLRLDSLAHDFRRHPVYVARAFRRYTGVSMHEYLRALRLRHARHELSATKRSIAAIAGEAGFTDASHLSRMFSDRLGLTPRAFRKFTTEVHPVQIRSANAS